MISTDNPPNSEKQELYEQKSPGFCALFSEYSEFLWRKRNDRIAQTGKVILIMSQLPSEFRRKRAVLCHGAGL